ncbi:hypothetical protein ABD87_15050 [Lysinibacillus sphaericus]|nr:hypothetical protein [Lysinibacillus sphaericus]
MLNKITCPHCNYKGGFYVKETVRGSTVVYYNENGDYAEDQTEMYSHLQHSGGKIAYCTQCDKRIGKSENLISGKEEECRKILF